MRQCELVGIVRDYDKESGIATIEQRNRFFAGDTVEFMPPVGDYKEFKIKSMTDEAGEDIKSAPHPQMIVKIPVDFELEKDTYMRKACNLNGDNK